MSHFDEYFEKNHKTDAVKDEEAVLNHILITREEYDFLSATYLYYSIILDAIFKDASLSWDKEHLSFGTDHLSRLMELIAKDRYWRVFMKLQEDEHVKSDKAGE